MIYQNKKWLWLTILGFFLFFSKENVFAANANISVSGSSKTVVVGNTVKVTITISSSQALGSWEFDVKYDSSKLTFVNSNLEGNMRSTNVGNGSMKSKTYTLTFKAKSQGSAKVWVTNSDAIDWDEKSMSTTDGSYTFNIITQKQLEDSYSKNNNLSSLSVEGYELTPVFGKDTLEYTLELENGIESIVVNAKAEDSKASVSGTGTKMLSEGDNRIVIRVTAQNGATKDYVINAKVKELNPIPLTIDGEEYTVVRKTDGLSIPSTFVETSMMMGEESVPIFESDITGYRLIALKDTTGKIFFFIMKEDGSYLLYQETSFNGITIFMITPPKEEIPSGYETVEKILLGETEISVYKNKDSDYPLIYGVNIQTGETNWYSYDEREGTLQRFDNSRIDVLSKRNDRLLFLIFVLSGCSFLLMLFLLIFYSKTRREIPKSQNLSGENL